MQWNPAVWFSDARSFLGEVRTEYRKVTFPTRQEAVAGTIGTLVIVAIITVTLGFVDFGLSRLMALVIE